MNWQIRTAVAADVAAVRDVLVRSWHATYDSIFGADAVADITGRWHTAENLTAQIRREDAASLVAEVDRAIVGTAFAKPEADGAVTLQRIYLVPEAQGRGLGKALLVATLAKFLDAARVVLEVESRNARAIAFYEKLGFAVIGGGSASGGDTERNYPHLIMEKRLI